MIKVFEDHTCVVDRDNDKVRIRVWPKNRGIEGHQEFTLHLTDKERLDLIHMLSE